MKIGAYTFFDNLNLEMYKTDMTNAWNLSKYQKAVVTSPPSWVASTGEEVLYCPASGGTTNYFYKGTAWISSWSVNI